MSQSGHYVSGFHSVFTLLKVQPKSIKTLWLLNTRDDQRVQDVHTLAEQNRLKIVRASAQELDTLLGWEGIARHQGIVAEIIEAKLWDEALLLPMLTTCSAPWLVLVLDGIQDPHNLGACLRSAEAMGVHAVVVPKDRAVGLTPVVRKVACGAAEMLPFFTVTNLVRTLKQLQEAGLWLVAVTAEATQTLDQVSLDGNLVLVMGGEHKGLRRLTQETCDWSGAIPMLGHVESLNVSVATGIALYEVCRQRRR